MVIPGFDNTAPPVQACGLLNRFGSNIIHENLDFTLKSEEILGIVGGSGSGKSVLMNTLLGLKIPEGGKIYYYGCDRSRLNDRERAAMNNEIGVLFQGGALFSSLTVRENIMVPLREHTDLPEPLMCELADMKIHMVGLPAHAATLFPSDLSGGMKKRAGLARSLALDPKLLFLDEPTAGLDPIGASAFDNLILDLREAMKFTVLMVTHDLDSLYTICDRVAVLVDKQIVVADRLSEVQNYPHSWVKQYFGGPRSRAAQTAGRI
ncbi:MAG: ATP-binding cassette domain-containing protein [Hyphomonadaceae bacterium]|nr:ATP-binding cassette domain-containing protein [Hyphomonadaceae bacterium]MBC6412955.1 ATP-binding cassette domain-containing protein [Hyphomonadaceae bacterium]